jgi:hypothetical protein
MRSQSGKNRPRSITIADDLDGVVVRLEDRRHGRSEAGQIEYLADMVCQLKEIARNGGHDRLATLLAIAQDEALARLIAR